jgi:hypothetical protein
VTDLGIPTTETPVPCGDGITSDVVNGSNKVWWESDGKGNINTVFVTDPRVQTLSGIHVGSTLDDLNRTYPGKLVAKGDTGGQQPGWLVYNETGAGYKIAFSVGAAGPVGTIVVSTVSSRGYAACD